MDSVAIYFLLADVGVLALNAMADRPLGRNSGALWLSGGLMFGQVLAVLLGTIDRPWRWGAASVVDLALLLGACVAVRQSAPMAHLGRLTIRRALWAYAMIGCLLVGISLQVTLWASWLPHYGEPYNWPIFGIFFAYVRVSRILSVLELCCVGSAGIWGVVATWGTSSLCGLYRVPRPRHSSR